jgi:uncharacterized protein with HEPN domain
MAVDVTKLDRARLDDILTASDDIAGFCEGLDLRGFENEKVVRYAILHSLTIIGEAANRLSEELRVKHGEIPWRRIIAFRHRLVHNYGELDLELVWEVARTLVPELRSQVAGIRATFPKELE